MRKVEIVDEPDGQRRWVVVDNMTGKVVIRLHDEDLLRNICRSFEWEIVLTRRQQSIG
jgi:predicted nucleic acid-binding OB-fold protein